ncbi:MAG: Gfo/Idh/MocA family oxidoreductase [Candidatus Shapirobacteria bacterium]|nr:Gfo/Idh/MocA family oxidoreductase [Candidatus Shapirobacteria bacterium]
MNKEIFITGSNGFIGQYLVNYLSQKGFVVYALLRKKSIPGFNLNKNVVCIIGDLLNKPSLITGIPKNSIVVNLAANPYHPKLSYKVNVEGTQNLIDVCKKNKVNRIIHISSQATKIENKGVYAKTKNKSDEIINNSGLNYVILKPSLVYGGGEKGLFNKIRSLVNKIPLVPIFGSGKTKVNPVYVEDLCKFIELTALNSKDKNSIYDVGSVKPITYNQLYRGIVVGIEKNIWFLHIPIWVGILFGKLFELAKLGNPPFFIDNVLGSTQETNCNPGPIIKKYKYEPLSFMEGLKLINKKPAVNVGMVGLGKMGLLHLSILSSFRDVDIVALIDTNRKLFTTIKSMGVAGNFYENIEEALKNEEINAVFVLTPTFTHLPIIKTLLKKNISIFVEKPATLNQGQLEEITKLKTSYKGIFNVGYTLLFKRIYREIKNIIDTKKYGKIKSFEINFEHGEVFGKRNGWMFSKEKSGGGVLMNPGPHVFSLINLLFGKPEKISGDIYKIYSLEVDDEARLNLDYKDFEGKAFLSWSVKNRNIATTTIKINFEKSELNTDGNIIEIIPTNGKMIKISEKDSPVLLDGTLNINPDANGEAYYIEDRLFVDSVKDKKDANINNFEFAYDTESMIFKSYLKSK